jgi:hypothetical protein
MRSRRQRTASRSIRLSLLGPPVIPDAEIWRAAMAVVKRYGDDAMLEAAVRARKFMAGRRRLVAAHW